MESGKGPPQSIDDLADEALEGYEKLLSPRSYAAIHSLIGRLYTTHPVMSRLADEALVDARGATLASEENIKPGVELPPAPATRKSDAG